MKYTHDQLVTLKRVVQHFKSRYTIDAQMSPNIYLARDGGVAIEIGHDWEKLAVYEKDGSFVKEIPSNTKDSSLELIGKLKSGHKQNTPKNAQVIGTGLFEADDQEEAPPEEEGGEEGDEEGADTEGMPSKAVNVNFDKAGVKRYNKTPIEGASGEVKQITPDGVVATVQPDGVDILIGFDDITESANSFFGSKKPIIMEKRKRPAKRKASSKSLTETIDQMIKSKLTEINAIDEKGWTIYCESESEEYYWGEFDGREEWVSLEYPQSVLLVYADEQQARQVASEAATVEIKYTDLLPGQQPNQDPDDELTDSDIEIVPYEGPANASHAKEEKTKWVGLKGANVRVNPKQ